MKILFWNTHNNIDVNAILFELIIENNINIVALAEYTAEINDLLFLLSNHGILMQQYHTVGCERIIIIGDIKNVIPGKQDDHYSFQIIQNKYILVCVHLPSQIFTNNEGNRNIEIGRIVTAVGETEVRNNTENTILLGDFNINPFDHGCIDANYFHSLPHYEVVKKQLRRVAKEKFKMFYNPMWRFFGDETQPYGTHYYDGSRVDNIFWNIYDQVMIRPCLRENFMDESLMIITNTNSWSLTDRNGHPDKKGVSDHLPIIFEIKEK